MFIHYCRSSKWVRIVENVEVQTYTSPCETHCCDLGRGTGFWHLLSCAAVQVHNIVQGLESRRTSTVCLVFVHGTLKTAMTGLMRLYRTVQEENYSRLSSLFKRGRLGPSAVGSQARHVR